MYYGICNGSCGENERSVGKLDCPEEEICCVDKNEFLDICKLYYTGTCRGSCRKGEHDAGKIDCLNEDICCVW